MRGISHSMVACVLAFLLLCHSVNGEEYRAPGNKEQRRSTQEDETQAGKVPGGNDHEPNREQKRNAQEDETEAVQVPGGKGHEPNQEQKRNAQEDETEAVQVPGGKGHEPAEEQEGTHATHPGTASTTEDAGEDKSSGEDGSVNAADETPPGGRDTHQAHTEAGGGIGHDVTVTSNDGVDGVRKEAHIPTDDASDGKAVVAETSPSSHNEESDDSSLNTREDTSQAEQTEEGEEEGDAVVADEKVESHLLKEQEEEVLEHETAVTGDQRSLDLVDEKHIEAEGDANMENQDSVEATILEESPSQQSAPPTDDPREQSPFSLPSEEESSKDRDDVKTGTPAKKPNIVLIVADDLGMGDVGCFGNDTIRTPNIDQLAKDGVKLTHHLAAASVCTPSRAAMLTGRYPIRMGMVPTTIVRVNMFLSSTGGLPPAEVTVGELAQKAGYATGYVGKWHLGMHCGQLDYCHYPTKQGFDHFYGLPLTNLLDFGDDGRTVTESYLPNIDTVLLVVALLGVLTAVIFRKVLGPVLALLLAAVSVLLPALFYWGYNNLAVFNAVLMRNYEVVEQPLRLGNRLAGRLADEGVEFIEKQSKAGKPFLLVMSWVQVHTALHTAPEFAGVSKHGRYGDNVEEMDWSVGQILKALTKNGLDDNTFVYFSSDNGGHTAERAPDGQAEGGWNGIYRGGKTMGGMEGGIRVPTVARFPGRISPGSVLDLPTSQMDVLPTVAAMMGVEAPDDRTIDGRDLSELLAGGKSDSPPPTPPHEFLFHYCGEDIHAARYTPLDGSGDVWKVHYVLPKWLPGKEQCSSFVCGCQGITQLPPLLYNLAKDPSERNSLDVTLPAHRAVISKLEEAMRDHRRGVEPADDQMAATKLLPVMSLQPCCGGGRFPNCDCTEPVKPAPGE